MKLLMYGVNKSVLSEEDLDNYLLSDSEVHQQLADISQFEGVLDLLILTSSDFVEYYFNVDESIFQHGDFLNYLSEKVDFDVEKVILDTYSKFNADLITHLYSLVSGLDLPTDNDQLLENIEFGMKHHHQANGFPFLNYLVNSIIQFVSVKKANKDYYDLFRSQSDIVLQTFIQSFNYLNRSRFFLCGLGQHVVPLAKKLHRNGARHLTVHTLDQDSDFVAQQLNLWSEDQVVKKKYRSFFAADTLFSRLYYLSNADGIYIDQAVQERVDGPRVITDQLNEQLKEIEKFRFNNKKQIFVGLDPYQSSQDLKGDGQELKTFDLHDNISLDKQDQLREVLDHYLAQADVLRKQLMTEYQHQSAQLY